VDEIEDALETEDGCKFLAETSGSTSIQAVLAGQTYLLLGQNYRLRRATAGDVNASVDAYVISADGVPLDGANGGIQFLIAQDLEKEIWGALTADNNTAGSFGKLLIDTLDSAISSRLATSGYTVPANADIAAIKAKTDSLAFTITGHVDANIQYINDVQVKGTGTDGDPWNPA
jgi:hypothetical protein